MPNILAGYHVVSHAMEVSDPFPVGTSICMSPFELLQTGHRTVLQYLVVCNDLVVGIRPGCAADVWKYLHEMAPSIAKTELLFVVLTAQPPENIYEDLLTTSADFQLLEACAGDVTATTEQWPLLDVLDRLRGLGIKRPSTKLSDQLKTLAFGGDAASSVACQARKLLVDWSSEDQQG